MVEDAAKVFVLDTSAILHDIGCLHSFEDNSVVIPMMVLRELDGLKRNPQKGFAARDAIRALDELFPDMDSMSYGVKTRDGGSISIWGVNGSNFALPAEYAGDTADDLILRVTGRLLQKRKEKDLEPPILVTKDMALRLKARAAGIQAEDLRSGKVERVGELTEGIFDIEVPGDFVAELNDRGSIEVGDLKLPEGMYPNACCRLFVGTRPTLGILLDGGIISVVRRNDGKTKGSVSPRNVEQLFAYGLCRQPSIAATTLVGVAGTGKTLMALRANIDMLWDNNSPIERVVVFRPMIELGSSLGFLPGTAGEKFEPWVSAIVSNLHLIYGGDTASKKKLDADMKAGKISVEPFTFVRGMTFSKTGLIVDEAQNLTPHEIKAVLTRAGEGSKVVLTGDLSQIDNPHLDAGSCGLAATLQRTRRHPMFASIELVKGERSRLAAEIARLFHDV